MIEHFKYTRACLEELYRVLQKGGVSFNTVPCLGLGTLYRQVCGNIPDFPVLKQLAELIHIRLLGGKHMRFGYELSFSGRTMKALHYGAGFADTRVDKFDVELKFEYVPRFLARPFTWLANNYRLFWPMVKVVGTK